MIPRKIITLIDKDKLIDHMTKDMVGDDRRLRFGYHAKDEAVIKYLEQSLVLVGWNSMWFVVENGGRIIATCHVAYDEKTQCAELGFTVDPQYRGRGLGQLLFDRGSTWANARGAKELYMQCLSENKVMQYIARKNAMTVITMDSNEKEASVTTSHNPMAAYVSDIFLDALAMTDCAIRRMIRFSKPVSCAA